MRKTVAVLDVAAWYELSSVTECGWAHQLMKVPDYNPDLILSASSGPVGPIRWEVIAEFLAYGLEFLRHDAPAFQRIGTFDYDFSTMTPREESFALDWFCTGPQGDPWTDELTNGRHRIAWMSRGTPWAPLPVKSDALIDTPLWGERIPLCDIETVVAGLARWEYLLPPTALNARYIRGLRQRYSL